MAICNPTITIAHPLEMSCGALVILQQTIDKLSYIDASTYNTKDIH